MFNQVGGFMEEFWKDIPNYEGYYQASTLGRIRSMDHYAMHSRGNTTVHRKGRIMKTSSNPDGYLSVLLSKEGKSTTYRVHRLVAMTFIPNPNNLPIINHKDLDKTNNVITNLEWVTQQENCLHAILNGHSPEYKQKRKIYCTNTNTVYATIRDAAACTGVPRSTISRVAHNGGCTRTGFLFMFV